MIAVCISRELHGISRSDHAPNPVHDSNEKTNESHTWFATYPGGEKEVDASCTSHDWKGINQYVKICRICGEKKRVK